MSNANHTPGPWRVRHLASQRKVAVIETSSGEAVADTYPNGRESPAHRHDPTDEENANARLIAAAPSLLAKLGEVRDHFSMLADRVEAAIEEGDDEHGEGKRDLVWFSEIVFGIDHVIVEARGGN